MTLRLPLLCLLLAFAASGQAKEPLTLQLCQSNEGDYPWTLPDRPGLNNLLIERAARRTGVAVRFHPMPWARCLFKTSAGEMDGVVGASYRPERLRIGVYPLKDGQPHTERRLMRNSYLLYRRKGDPRVHWDGQRLQVNGVVGVQTGFSVAGTLQRLGAAVDQQHRLPRPLLQQLLSGRLQAIALTAAEGQRLLAEHPQGSTVEALPAPLEEKDFYLVFSRQFQRQHPALVERLWQALWLEQQTPEWRTESGRFR
ncbi:MAG TPA: transporter substrate-binding domain-containing protein [Candidatus Kapabacteria bacterium]|nr:transporter substrate-binding domain-containing protein [Candidatus Kapabacteria bacterium]